MQKMTYEEDNDDESYMFSNGDLRSESMKWNMLAQLNPSSAAANKINPNISVSKSSLSILDSESSFNQAQLRFTLNKNKVLNKNNPRF